MLWRSTEPSEEMGLAVQQHVRESLTTKVDFEQRFEDRKGMSHVKWGHHLVKQALRQGCARLTILRNRTKGNVAGAE